MPGEIARACDEMDTDPECRVIAVAGEGKAFSPGLDMHDQADNTPQGHDF